MERNPAHCQGDDRFQFFHPGRDLLMPVPVHIRIVRWKNSGLNGRLRIIPYQRWQPQIPHAPETGTHFPGVYRILPGIDIGLFAGITEAALAVGQFLILLFLTRDVLNVGINYSLVLRSTLTEASATYHSVLLHRNRWPS